MPVQVAADEPSVARQYELRELRGRLDAAIGELPVSLRELFVWRHVNGLSYVAYDTVVLGRKANADLKRLGF